MLIKSSALEFDLGKRNAQNSYDDWMMKSLRAQALHSVSQKYSDLNAELNVSLKTY